MRATPERLAAAAERTYRPPGRRIAAWAGLLLVAAVTIAVWVFAGRGPGVRSVRETSRELLVGPPTWTVVSSAVDRPPHADVLTPSLDWMIDGGDLSALVMPPPCEVRFEIRPEDGPVYLRASAGVDRRLRWQLQHAPEDCAVVFEIDVDGERRFTHRVIAHETGAAHAWQHAGGREGIPLEPGDVVTLRTSLSHPDAPIFGSLPLRAGFGRLELERAVERPFVRSSEDQPNVLLIVMDTLRADELSCYGATEHATPALDALAARGILHERAYATSSWTWPSTASILTGLPPEAHGVLEDWACYLDGSLDTLAEVLGREGLATGAFACNPLLDPAKNFDQGFESYDYSRDFRMSSVVLPDVVSWIDRHADVRFFLYLHLVDPHHPMLARAEDFERVGIPSSPPAGSPEQPLIEYARELLVSGKVGEDGRVDPDLVVPEEEQRWIRKAYCASVLSADHYVGEVLRALEQRGLAEKTLVAFTSDHGEELFDHGLLGHGSTLHQELVRVPLILAGPGVPRGERLDTPVGNEHLFETLATRGGGSAGAVAKGVDLATAKGVRDGAVCFSTEKGWWWNAPRTPIRGVLEWPWVLHVAPRGLPWGAAIDADPGAGAVHLYDLDSDPQELVDRAAERADLVARLRQRWEEHARSAADARARVGIPASRAGGAGDATIDLLRRIGYTGDAR